MRTAFLRNVVSRAELGVRDFPRLDEAGYPMISCFVGNEVVLEIDFLSRLVVLLFGRLLVRTTLQTDARVEHLRSASKCWTIYPDWLYRLYKNISRS